KIIIGVYSIQSCITLSTAYHVEKTRSRQLPAVKLRRVPLVLRRVTTWEYGMLLASNLLSSPAVGSCIKVLVTAIW
ncbi:Uncharacterized protein APZ42_006920, partial [Daphnia magna]